MKCCIKEFTLEKNCPPSFIELQSQLKCTKTSLNSSPCCWNRASSEIVHTDPIFVGNFSKWAHWTPQKVVFQLNLANTKYSIFSIAEWFLKTAWCYVWYGLSLTFFVMNRSSLTHSKRCPSSESKQFEKKMNYGFQKTAYKHSTATHWGLRPLQKSKLTENRIKTLTH